ncbi:hypothetical protein KPSA1_04773 [Pseudomonas syringae pv. actinidiae]|uniref:Uncharacterized protein n=1 Tax=Pseudomonas syringae pv. actinidiae TaxID=103796 RepID=A0A2V0QDR9_PSESF|nr:hypothetical protein KPSA1_04773 [Pseudomonas syringae pv. actinidiae]
MRLQNCIWNRNDQIVWVCNIARLDLIPLRNRFLPPEKSQVIADFIATIPSNDGTSIEFVIVFVDKVIFDVRVCQACALNCRRANHL